MRRMALYHRLLFYVLFNVFILSPISAIAWDFEEAVPISANSYPQMPTGVSIFSFTVTFDPSATVRRSFTGGESYLIQIPLPAGVNGVQAAFQSNFADPLSGIGFYANSKPEFCAANVTGSSATPCGSGNYIYLDDGNGNRFEPVKGQASIGIYDLRFEDGPLQNATTGYLGLYLQPGASSRYDSSAIGFSISIGDRALYEQWWCENVSRQCGTVTPPSNNAVLNVSAIGSGSVSVRNGSIELGRCAQNSGSCRYTQTQGTNLSLVALPANSGTSVSWNGNNAQCSANNGTVQSVTLNNNISCSVRFTEEIVTNQFNLSITTPSNGTVSSNDNLIRCGSNGSSCVASYIEGQQATLQATADTGFRFAGWTGSCSGSSTTTTVTMNQAKNCSASFAAQTVNNTAPEAHFAYWYDTSISTIYLDASASFDADGDSLSYQWHNSSKQTDFQRNNIKTSIDFSNEPQFTQTVTLIVTDSRGGLDSISKVIELPRPMAVDFSVRYTNGLTITPTEDDPNVHFAINDANVTFNANVTPITNNYTYQWSISDYPVLNNNQSDLTVTLQNKDFLYAVTLLVTDQNGRSESISKLLKVASDSQQPVIQNINVQPTGIIDDLTGLLAVSLDSGTSYDPDGGNLTYTWSSTGTCGGTACNIATTKKEVLYFVYDTEGTYSITLTATDEEGQAIQSQAIEVDVRRPVFSGLEITPLGYDEAQNDFFAVYGEPVTLQISAQSGVTQGSVSKYTWSYTLSNGVKTKIGETVTPNISFTPTQAGSYIFLVEIEDNYQLNRTVGSGAVRVDLPPVGRGRSSRSRTNDLGVSDAEFRAAVIDSQQQAVLGNQDVVIKQTDPIQLQFTIDVSKQDVGQTADIVSLIEFEPQTIQQGQWYMQSQSDTQPYITWNQDQGTASFTFRHRTGMLNAQEHVTVFEGQLSGLVGEFKVFSGYRLKSEDNTLIFNETPLQFTVEQ